MRRLGGWRLLGMLVALSLVAAACGDDDDGGEVGTGPDPARYCELSAQLDEKGDEAFADVDFQDEEAAGEAFRDFVDRDDVQADLRELEAVAPEEIAADVATLVATIERVGAEGDASLFDDSEDAEERLEVWEDENCQERGPDSESFGGTELTEDQLAEATTVEITAIEYGWENFAPELPAGPVVLRMANGGEEDHEIGIVRVAEGSTAQEVIAAALADPESDDLPPGAESFLGGMSVDVGGEPAENTFLLEPGEYAYACFIEADDGEPHALKGMIGSFSVA